MTQVTQNESNVNWRAPSVGLVELLTEEADQVRAPPDGNVCASQRDPVGQAIA
jgi:hypothetical protein